MEKHMKATHGWLSQEHKKVCKELNIIEPTLKRKKTITEKTMIALQYLLLSKYKLRNENILSLLQRIKY